MTLRELVEEMEVSAVRGELDRPVGGLAYDSRRVREGDVFFALPGLKDDGARFAEEALAKGAVAVVGGPGADLGLEAAAAMVVTAEPRLALAQAANRFFGHPSRALRLVAVTGTNGKTTTTWMLEAIFRAAGWSAGVIGTTGVRFAGVDRPAAFTTPESPELQGLLAEMRGAGVEAVAIEVSSHALVQRRSYGLECDAAIFTNLTQDHLDYHGTMDAYLDAKRMLFDGRNGATTKPGVAVVNADDPAAPHVSEAAAAGGLLVRRFSMSSEARDVDTRVEEVLARADGLTLGLALAPPASDLHLRLPLLGRFNASNAAGAVTAAIALGIDPATVARGLESMRGVPGRLERVAGARDFNVVVDYAHTPDALERALAAVREHAGGRVILVFGCGGDRDRGKRPAMGAKAAGGADLAWVTNDNPRSEDPARIAAEIVVGMAGGIVPTVELDRRAAIAAAIGAAQPGDVVLIAGKGHETTQTIGDRVLPFDDRAVAGEILRGGART